MDMGFNTTAATDEQTTETFICNMTISGKIFQLRSNDLSELPSFCDPEQSDAEADGAAMYAIVTISLFATAIGLFIAMLSFKKKKYDEWDSQAGEYLGGLYERRLMEEKRVMSRRAQSVVVPHLGILQLITGMSRGEPPRRQPNDQPRSKSSPYVHDPNWIEMSDKADQPLCFNNHYTNNASDVVHEMTSSSYPTWTPQHAAILEEDNEETCCLDIGELSTESVNSHQSQSTWTEVLSNSTSCEKLDYSSQCQVISPLDSLSNESSGQTLSPNMLV